ncbi:MAG TPA: DUF456 domain-containing protein [Syntrophales bacterium]|nr:DUF456 domain-containing protein [Syntrophales bacterium]HOM07885.1 DUF456 domain-containing protein [Syntrophales bacterium]HOO00280.1 DUF456 domain-containing protein [Syntrophales bacterium]HPC01779.1 DUF456 domain-containing protein [Syntrophales bacterium]HPQ07376.1 DUF456 domain-containing protein [Syntrophales bacterium]
MSPLEIAGLTAFIIILLVGLLAVALGLPGAAVIFLAGLGYAAVTRFENLGWKTLLILFLLAVAAEGMEFLATVAKVFRPSLSRKGFLAALAGSTLGIYALAPLLLGPGVLIGLFGGALSGLFLVEAARQGRLKAPFRAGPASLLGGMALSMVRGSLAMIMISLTLINVYS